MNDGSIKIQIGASLDRSVSTVFGDIEKRAQRAGQAINKAFSSGGSVGGGGVGAGSFDKTAKAAEKAANAAIKAADKQHKEVSRAAKEMQRDWEKAENERAKATEKADKAIAASNKAAAQQRKQEAAAAKREADVEARGNNRFSRDFGRSALRNTGQMFSMAGRFGMDLARGAGVETSAGSLISRTVGIEAAATALSNRGHIEGAEGPNGTVISSKQLESEARAAGKATAVNPEELLSAGRAFVGLTGDLDLWRKIMPDIAKQTAALGGNQEDAAKAAGEFATHLGDVKDKDVAIESLMRVAAGQGKIGGVDFSDFARYASRAAAPAGSFAGDKAENIGKLTGLAEITKVHGGATSAAEAFQGVTSFVNALKKPARLKSIEHLLGNGDSQFVKGSNNSTLRDVNKIIEDIIWASSKDKKAKGGHGMASLVEATRAVGDVRAMKPINGLLQTFNAAGGGTEGMNAVEAELKKFDGAIMSTTEITRANNAQLQTTKSQAELFNQSLENVTHGMVEGLSPAMRTLEPQALKAADGIGALATWAANNPLGGVGVALGAAVAKAGLGTAFRAALETAASKGINIQGATSVMALGAVTFAAVAAAAHEASAISRMTGAKHDLADVIPGMKDGNFSFSQLGDDILNPLAREKKAMLALSSNLGAGIRYMKEPTAMADDRGQYDDNQERAKNAVFTKAGFDNPGGTQANDHLSDIKETLALSARSLELLRSGQMQVILMNPQDIKAFGSGPAVPAAGRGPDPGDSGNMSGGSMMSGG